MGLEFAMEYRARWSDMDFNQHMRNASFLAYAEDTRMGYLAAAGWTMPEFERLRFGPVVLEDRLIYKKELKLLETFKVDIALSGMNGSGSRMRVVNRFYKVENAEIAATVESTVLWLDLDRRKSITPPPALLEHWTALPKTDDFSIF